VQHQSAFGEDAFGRYAEGAARFFGTPQYIVGQTIVVIAWVVLNAVGLTEHWDEYPFILLNLAFSLQAAYAAPLILLAQTRQAKRDKVTAERDESRSEMFLQRLADGEAAITQATSELKTLLESNTDLTRQDKELTERVEGLTREIHAAVQRG
jgi:uncharacterized membrane protein